MSHAVLVATPTYAGKAYCLDEYVESVRAFTYPDRELLLVDNTRDNLAYFNRIVQLGVIASHMEPHETFADTTFCAFKGIAEYAHVNDFEYILSLEQDVIIPPTALDHMVRRMQRDDLCVLIHHTPPREGTGWALPMAELGCTLVRTEDWLLGLDRVLEVDGGMNFAQALVQASHRYAVTGEWFKGRHLDGPGNEWPFEDADLRAAPNDPAIVEAYRTWGEPRMEVAT